MAYNRNNAVKAYLSNDSDYRAWWDAIRAQFTAIGLVQTSDTGQLNPASHTRPTTNSFSGYEVWRWADTLQASLPIYMRIRPVSAQRKTGPLSRLRLVRALTVQARSTGRPVRL